MSFTNLKARYVAYQENEKREKEEYIRNGVTYTYYGGDPKDAGIRNYSTETRWNQYQDGEITREQAINYAIKRMTKQIDKETAAKVAELDRIAAAPEIAYIRVSIEWKRSYMWGYNPTCEVYTDRFGTTSYGKAGGCGYDKESAAVADAFNDNDAILKVLYTLKEKALEAGADDYRKEVITKVDNRTVIGYGAGYSVIPYFEGGVGVSCFWSILAKAGFECRSEHGKSYDVYRLERVK